MSGGGRERKRKGGGGGKKWTGPSYLCLRKFEKEPGEMAMTLLFSHQPTEILSFLEKQLKEDRQVDPKMCGQTSRKTTIVTGRKKEERRATPLRAQRPSAFSAGFVVQTRFPSPSEHNPIAV